MTEARDFWSRRKAAVQAEAEAEIITAEEQAIAVQQSKLEEKSDAEILAEFNLPDPDQLQAGDDVSGFMAKAVPDRLRRRALRRLWRLNPVLANVDGLVDYGEDYTDAACVIENLQTAYQVGKGMLAHVEALAAEAENDAEETPERDVPPEEPEAPTDPTPEPVLVAEADTPADASEEAEVAPAPRRMKFEFEG
ncbi:DUF3306 domain-containing protein [Ruegeria sp. Ofav3-42]|uniref:DUF3306 domain-containing protein n=1 Tax=Ruegeria sp. Ofav3-42 TaxID=2917759 RepID=UPI001EF635C0|nr:DUF3306 domain-containing protein [Ruegeria sp. Ofav3-42]MCG7519588.1 DUF3306 domain-containing protein [Ruegeria sp. Ofav3-42]